MLSDLPKTSTTPEIRVDCPDNLKFKIVEELTEHFRKDYDVVDIDGVRVNFDGGWGLVRASNTQPAIVLRFEANDSERLREVQEIVQEQMKKYEPDVIFNIVG
jgi:phosphomannomutase/phosphoglucomutase